MAATSRLARFISEACPPQFVSVMRRRSPKVLDTINEEDHREALSSSSSLKIDKFSVSSLPSTMAASPPSPATSAAVSSKYFLNQFQWPSESAFRFCANRIGSIPAGYGVVDIESTADSAAAGDGGRPVLCTPLSYAMKLLENIK
ncbi:hypothetical protein SDJN02_18461, partial [Cucurbita argyrosperma subsp. argyrosperma]